MVDTDAIPAKAPVTERGYVTPQTDWQHWDENEKVPELQWPNSVHVFARMAREDGRVASLLQAIGLPIRRTTWRVDSNGARPEVTEFVAENLGLAIKGEQVPRPRPRSRGRFSWSEHLQTALLQLTYGHSFFEQVYFIDDAGMARLRKLAPRPAASISRINVARDGGLMSIEQHGDPGPLHEVAKQNKGIPIDRLVVYVRDPEPGQWIGKSILRPAYKHWLLKDEFLRIQAATARRNGMGVPMYQGPAGASEADLAKGRQMASEYKGGMNSGLAIPEGADFKLLGVNGNLPDMQQAINYHDKQIALAGLAHFLNLDGGGSYALASVQESVFTQSVQAFTETICDTANKHIVEDLVDINFGPDEPAPRIVFDEIGSKKDAVAGALKTLVDAGILFPDRTLEEAVRDDYGLPSKDTPPPVAASSAPRRRPKATIDTNGAMTLW